MNTITIVILCIVAYILITGIRNRILGIKIQNALTSGALVADVRSPQEYASDHFSTAINVPYDQVERRLAEFGSNKTRTVILYCHAGSRSAAAEQVLRKNGFASIVNARNLKNIKRFDAGQKS